MTMPQYLIASARQAATLARLLAAMTKRQDNPHLIRQRPAIVPGFLCPRGHASWRKFGVNLF